MAAGLLSSGGVVLASMGDRVGRKPVLIACLAIMTVGTVGIGLLPLTAPRDNLPNIDASNRRRP